MASLAGKSITSRLATGSGKINKSDKSGKGLTNLSKVSKTKKLSTKKARPIGITEEAIMAGLHIVDVLAEENTVKLDHTTSDIIPTDHINCEFRSGKL